jgi:hypothetical protein
LYVSTRGNEMLALRVHDRKKPGKWPGKHFSAAAGALTFWLSRPRPPALEVTGDLDKEESHDKRSGNILRTGLT